MRAYLFLAAFLSASNAISAQGDFNGVFSFSLYRISEGLLAKECIYRAYPNVKRQRRLQNFNFYTDLIYELEAKDGSKVELNVYVHDSHSLFISRSPREIYIEHWKKVARFSNCPDNLSLKYNVLTREFRES